MFGIRGWNIKNIYYYLILCTYLRAKGNLFCNLQKTLRKNENVYVLRSICT
jgi:hypothetical protein